MKRILLFVLISAGIMASKAQVKNKMAIPDVPGYVTLKGDMHIHTIFSDANVWPTTRVEEAMIEGLDFIAITDHMDGRLQKMKNKGLFNADTNESFKIASGVADKCGVIVIHGGEITHGMPPGHFNTTFINDCEPIAKAADGDTDPYKGMVAGLEEAKKQGGFLVWNHPHWCAQAPNETKWYEDHTKILKAGLMMGIEVFNQFEGFSKEAFHWAVKNNLTIVSGTDAHSPIFTWLDIMNGEFRPVTLVFAKERTEKSIHEALIAHRTAVFAEGNVYGTAENILPLNEAILTVKKASFSEKKANVVLYNNSCMPIILRKDAAGKDLMYPTYIMLRPFAEYSLSVSCVNKGKLPSLKEISLPFIIENFYTDADVSLKRTIKVTPTK